MPHQVAWRILTDQKGRTLLAAGGIFVAVLLIFVELGFFVAVPEGGLLIYSHMRFDVLIVSDKYLFQSESGSFPQARLAAARAVPAIAAATPVYFGNAKWQDPSGGLKLDVTVIGIDPAAGVFDVPGIERQRAVLERPETVLVDSATRPLFGPLTAGRVVNIAGRRTTIGGTYQLGTGFLGLGVALASEADFFRLFPQRPQDTVNLGLVRLRPGAGPDAAARALRAALPADMRVFTRSQLFSHEVEYWTTRTATGLIFGSGLIVSFVVGIMVLYQTLATQITRQLPQFATLKAIGYSNRFLTAIVVSEALLLMIAAFVPALGAAFGVYAVVRSKTLLPLTLTATEFVVVFVLTMAMAAAASVLSLGALRRADPADVF